MSLLQLRDVTAGYGDLPVVRDLSLEVGSGEVVALLGPNGAGKTTTILTIAGLLPSLGGEVDVLGFPPDVRRPHLVARRGLAVVPDNRGLFFQLTVEENLRLAAKGGRRSDYLGVVDRFPPLQSALGRRCGLLSGGEQQMLSLAKALVARPRLVVVDEMSLGLAPTIVAALLPSLRELAVTDGVGVLLVEQHALLALEYSDRAYVMNHGEVVFTGAASEVTPDLLARSYLGC